MSLLPLPLMTGQLIERRTQLLQRRQKETFAEIAESRVAEIYAWRQENDPVSRRIYRNVTQVYPREELLALVHATLAQILPDDAEADNA